MSRPHHCCASSILSLIPTTPVLQLCQDLWASKASFLPTQPLSHPRRLSYLSFLLAGSNHVIRPRASLLPIPSAPFPHQTFRLHQLSGNVTQICSGIELLGPKPRLPRCARESHPCCRLVPLRIHGLQLLLCSGSLSKLQRTNCVIQFLVWPPFHRAHIVPRKLQP